MTYVVTIFNARQPLRSVTSSLLAVVTLGTISKVGERIVEGVREHDVQLPPAHVGPDVKPGLERIVGTAVVGMRVVGVCHEDEGFVKPFLDDRAEESTIHGQSASDTAVVEHIGRVTRSETILVTSRLSVPNATIYSENRQILVECCQQKCGSDQEVCLLDGWIIY